MPALIHHLTRPGELTASTVACGDPTAAVATWHAAQVTCPQCKPPAAPRRARTAWTEKAFQDAVRELALTHNWLYYHTFDARKSPPGYVDCTLVRGPRLLCAELKMPGKRPTPAQQAWLDALGQVRQVETRVWYPEDLDTILEVLR